MPDQNYADMPRMIVPNSLSPGLRRFDRPKQFVPGAFFPFFDLDVRARQVDFPRRSECRIADRAPTGLWIPGPGSASNVQAAIIPFSPKRRAL